MRRRHNADKKIILYTAVAYAVMVAWGVFTQTTAGTQPLIGSTLLYKDDPHSQSTSQHAAHLGNNHVYTHMRLKKLLCVVIATSLVKLFQC